MLSTHQSLPQGVTHLYFGKVRLLANSLAATGSLLSDKELVTYLLYGLSPSYENFVTSITTRLDPLILMSYINSCLFTNLVFLTMLNLPFSLENSHLNTALLPHVTKEVVGLHEVVEMAATGDALTTMAVAIRPSTPTLLNTTPLALLVKFAIELVMLLFNAVIASTMPFNMKLPPTFLPTTMPQLMLLTTPSTPIQLLLIVSHMI